MVTASQLSAEALSTVLELNVIQFITCVSVCERERERESVCVFMYACVSVSECVCVCVFVCVFV